MVFVFGALDLTADISRSSGSAISGGGLLLRLCFEGGFSMFFETSSTPVAIGI